MSVLYNDDVGYFISHELFISKLYRTAEKQQAINTRSKDDDDYGVSTKRKRKHLQPMVNEIVQRIKTFISNLKTNSVIFSVPISTSENNSCARQASIEFYEKTKELKTLFGQNSNPILHEENGYMFPPNCKFYCDDVINMKKLGNEKYDLILMDPPWTNTYIQRRKKFNRDEGYSMMIDKDLAQLPIDDFLNTNGLVCVWCTNSQNHIDSLKSVLFPAWKVKYLACWYWIKVTKSGEFICNFASSTGKQPYERIIFGRKIDSDSELINPEENKLIASVPSSVHSHKPPLTELLTPYLPSSPKCLELFSRYLLPNWTSFGLEALKFQHKFMFETSTIEHCLHKSKTNL
ncbi:methyltransferase-like protein 4 isoform X2 [Sipha flava]|uniref:Methyltransferase-like protein 4 isoform X2 n=1 Tax=Sipha flava TaxID=143950 RepID=A0A8B8FQ62_9HEMI|nr:methyltransferase-like protein 4 isoform X2 [Sipha flava]